MMIIASMALIVCSSFISKVVIAPVDEDVPIYSVNTGEKKVALTINLNWNDNNIDTILNVIDTYRVNATFFIMGNWCDDYPSKVKEIADRGHEIGNLSNKYPNFTIIAKERIEKEVQITNGKILNLAKKMPTLFRFPEGKYNELALDTVRAQGLNLIQWNVDSKAWGRYEESEIDEILKRNIKKGDIILLENDDENMVESLSKIIECLQSQGYEIVNISDLIGSKGHIDDGDRAKN